MRVCLDVDAGWWPLRGRRARSAHAARRCARPSRPPRSRRAVVARPELELDGLMSYEAHIAGVGDRPPGRPLHAAPRSGRCSARRARELAARRAAVVAAVRAVAPLRFVNGGGTGSVERTAAEPAVTEVAAGLGPLRPDAVRRLPRLHARARPRCSRCRSCAGPTPRTRDGARRRLPGLGRGRAPTGCRAPCCRRGLRLDRAEGAGEVQTPAARPGARAACAIGDRGVVPPRQGGRAVRALRRAAPRARRGDRRRGADLPRRGADLPVSIEEHEKRAAAEAAAALVRGRDARRPGHRVDRRAPAAGAGRSAACALRCVATSPATEAAGARARAGGRAVRDARRARHRDRRRRPGRARRLGDQGRRRRAHAREGRRRRGRRASSSSPPPTRSSTRSGRPCRSSCWPSASPRRCALLGEARVRAACRRSPRRRRHRRLPRRVRRSRARWRGALDGDPGRRRARALRAATGQRRADRARRRRSSTATSWRHDGARRGVSCAAPVIAGARGRARSVEVMPADTRLWHPFADMHAVRGDEFVIARGEGAYVWDEDGQPLPRRHGEPVVRERRPRPRRRSSTPPRRRCASSRATRRSARSPTARALELAERLADLAPLDDPRIFLGSGGGDAIDTAAKLARRYFAAIGTPERVHLISRSQGYHGTHGLGHVASAASPPTAGHRPAGPERLARAPRLARGARGRDRARRRRPRRRGLRRARHRRRRRAPAGARLHRGRRRAVRAHRRAVRRRRGHRRLRPPGDVVRRRALRRAPGHAHASPRA